MGRPDGRPALASGRRPEEELLAFPVLHADKTHRAYLWSYSIGAHDPVRAVIYDFADSRAGKHAQDFLGDWRGTLVCDDYSGYKALIAQGVTEAGCMAHARRKFFELQEHGQSQMASVALERIAALYAIEQAARELDVETRQALRQQKATPLLEVFKTWMLACRGKIPNGSSSAKAIDYTLKRWAALTHYLTDGNVPIACRLSRRVGLGSCCRIDGGRIQSQARARWDSRGLTIVELPECGYILVLQA